MKPTATSNYFSGWNITKWLTFAMLVHYLVAVYILGLDKETVTYLIRATAKTSFILFILSFSASSLYYFWKNRLTKWLLQNRRYLGVSFASSHFLHLGALLLMTFYISFNVFEDRGLITTVGGGIGYLFIALMTITSFDSTKNMISAKNWKRLHLVGSYYLSLIFVKSYLFIALENYNAAFFSVLLVAVFVLRIAKMFTTIKKKA